MKWTLGIVACLMGFHCVAIYTDTYARDRVSPTIVSLISLLSTFRSLTYLTKCCLYLHIYVAVRTPGSKFNGITRNGNKKS